MELINTNKTRSNGSTVPDSSLYLVNFTNNDGFAIVAADKRMPRQFYAMSDEGNLSLRDTISNKALALVLSNLFDVAYNDYTVAEALVDTTAWTTPIAPPANGTVLISKVASFLNHNVKFWNQGEPFNTYCYTSTNEHAWVGCAPVAVALVLSHYEWPSFYTSTSHVTHHYNWTSIKSNIQGNNDLYHLLRDIGNPENLNVSYRNDNYGSSAYPENFRRTFINFGFFDCGNFEGFSPVKALRFIGANYPILVIGKRNQNGVTSGHAWVCDGYVQYRTPKEDNYIGYDENYYFHCIWGWGGNSNGYFLDFGGTPFDREDDDPENCSGTNGRLYNLDVKMLYKFKINE